MSEKPMMELSGVRSSWLTAANMRLLASSVLSTLSDDAASAILSAAVSSFARSRTVIDLSPAAGRIISMTKGR